MSYLIISLDCYILITSWAPTLFVLQIVDCNTNWMCYTMMVVTSNRLVYVAAEQVSVHVGLYYAFSEKPRWCSTEQVCQEVKCKTLNNPEDWMLFYTRPYIFDCTPAKAEQVLYGSRIPKVYPQLVLLTYKETHYPRSIHIDAL